MRAGLLEMGVGHRVLKKNSRTISGILFQSISRKPEESYPTIQLRDLGNGWGYFIGDFQLARTEE
jgi:hypothetical protein